MMTNYVLGHIIVFVSGVGENKNHIFAIKQFITVE
jgi:hypothetical protein